MSDKQLYEYIISCIDRTIYSELNEAYNNMLFEELNFKDVFNTAIQKTKQAAGAVKNAATNAKIDVAYRFIKKYIAGVVEEIKKTKGVEAAQKYIDELKPKIVQLCKDCDIDPKAVQFTARLAAIGFVGVMISASIEKNVRAEMAKEGDKEIPFIVQYDRNYIENSAVRKEQGDKVANPDFSEYKSGFKDNMFDTKVIQPYELYKEGKTMTPTADCQKYIKYKEALSLYPYYATDKEKAKHIITLGYGHVICMYDKHGKRHWYFPDEMSNERCKEIQAAVLAYEKNGWIVRSKCDTINGQNVNIKHHDNAKPIITKAEAEMFFKKDLQIANQRVLMTLGFVSCGEDYDVVGKINKNVAAYCYYNQNIYDLLVSCTFNTGVLQNKTNFSQRLQKCRFDEKANMINTDDFAYTFQAFCTLSNPTRRTNEYNHFGIDKIDKVLKHFNLVKDKLNLK